MSTLTLTLPFQRELIYEDETIEFTEHQRDFLLVVQGVGVAAHVPYKRRKGRLIPKLNFPSFFQLLQDGRTMYAGVAVDSVLVR